MAWNDPPSFEYQQIANTGRKFKHRYVLSDTNSKFNQSSSPFQQHSSMMNANRYQQQPMAPINQGHLQQPFTMDNSQPVQLMGAQMPYSSSSSSSSNNNNNNNNGNITNAADFSSIGSIGAYQGLNGGHFAPNGYSGNDTSHNNFNNQTAMNQSQQQHFQSAPPLPPQQMILHQQHEPFQTQ